MTKKEEILKEFEELTDESSYLKDMSLLYDERYRESKYEIDEDKVKKWLSSKLDELIAERDREWREHINKYFDGLTMIPSAHLTKDKILDSMK